MSFWSDLMARKRLIKAFRAGGIHLTVGSDERKIYPKIHSIRTTEHSTEYVFTLPTGLDPKTLTKNLYVFQQVFGKNITVDGEFKKYVLTINNDSLPKELIYKYKDITSSLEGLEMPIVCGKNSAGEWMVYNAVTEPNCLVSGEPGAGKSTQVRQIITTLIQVKSPEELHIYLGDLKMSEFFLFKRVKHVKSVCVYPDDMARMLEYIHKELERRGELLNKFNVTHITKLPESEKQPFILLCIDEIVMIMDDKDMKKQLVQIVALGRALGIYCILSLQRPSHDILDTKIRGLLTVRMGFRTTDITNSKIIGTQGSEKISKETPGRFLIKRDELTELQAPYLTEDEAEKILMNYRVRDWKDMFARGYKVKEVKPDEPKQLTEEDVFG
ncbi:chromosome partitioning protein ParA [Bacillus sp. FJAT-27225]|uniref:FtsK/SpoIIIE domain-containing protein n=1 Tax=Bacillus sp. FJAT-27225 TaxID=1743144 RepID=UPI00080C27AE|nr:FtsK/SpoIIIE domain-containing protein [Bacillus sp. FJAT-27225]OCA84473.1 chromosome partitioning protein ParA [Bacillus sp. FJAT-27225]